MQSHRHPPKILQKAHDQAHLERDELLRLEDEGGQPANKEQAAKVEQLNDAARRIDRLMPKEPEKTPHEEPL